MQPGTCRIIPVKAKGHTVFALVSPEDYERASQFHWRLNTGGYARRRASRRDGDGSRPDFLMHRELLGLERGNPLTCDHINRDRLDNRRENLRAVTMAENNRNIGSTPGSTSRHRGVCWYAARGKWRASAEFMKEAFHVGDFDREEDAARAVNAFWVERGYPAPNAV